MEPSEQVNAIEPRFHPNPPPKSTAEFRRYCLTGKNVLKAVRRLGHGVGSPVLDGPAATAAASRQRAQGRRCRMSLLPTPRDAEDSPHRRRAGLTDNALPQ